MSESPTIFDAVRNTVAKGILALHTAMPGEVQTYNATNQTADVKPLLKWQSFLPGQLRSMVDLPVLPDVLVAYPRGSTGVANLGVHWPLYTGSLVLLVFCSRSIGNWRAQPNPSQTSDPGRALQPTPLDAAIAIPLMTHDSAPFPGAFADTGVISLGNTGLPTDFVALASKVATELNAIKTAFDAHIHDDPVSGVTSAPKVAMPAPGTTAASEVKAT